MDRIPAEYRSVHLLTLVFAIGGINVVWFMARGMYKIRETPVATARCMQFITAHTIIATVWIGLASARGLHLTEGMCRWPLDFIQYGILQGGWVFVWALRLVVLENSSMHRYPRRRSIIPFYISIWGIPVTSALAGFVTGTCSALITVDALIALASLIHLGVMHAILLRYRKLQSPLCISPEAEWCCILTFALMVATAFCIGTSYEYVARHCLTPATVVFVAVAWQYIQCKPAFVERDTSYDHVMQDQGEYATTIDPTPDLKGKVTTRTNNQRIAAFLNFCNHDFPATVHMICVLTKQLQARSPGEPTESSLTCAANQSRFMEEYCDRGVRNSEYVGFELTNLVDVNVGNSATLRHTAYNFLLRECSTSYEAECANRITLVKCVSSASFMHPACKD